MRAVQRTWVHAVVRDGAGGVLLVPAAAGSPLAGRWLLPGGRLRHGEQPRDGVLRELAAIGLAVTRTAPLAATADLVELPQSQVSLHTVRLVYDAERATSALPSTGSSSSSVPSSSAPFSSASSPSASSSSSSAGSAGSSPSAARFGGGRFVRAPEAARLPLAPFVAEVLGLSEHEPLHSGPDELTLAGAEHEDFDDLDDVRPAPFSASSAEVAVPVQRPAAYAVLVDGYDGPASRNSARMLLTRLSGSESTWTLPGGGIDHGEHPLVALVRELWEEAGLPYTVGPLIDIGSRHFTGRTRNGRLEDFQGIRLVYAGSVPTDRTPTVVEVNGSTDATAWIPLPDLERVGAVPAAREALARWIELTDRGGLRDAG